MNYLLSVVIPTKDRYIYLKECLQSLIDLKSDMLEIVVQDNTAINDEILSYISLLNWPHLKYYHYSYSVSQTENSDLAVSHALGEYCCYIGDDDSISNAALEIAQYMKDNRIIACACNVATYHWKDIVFQGRKKPTLSFDDRKMWIKDMNSKKILKKVLSYGVQDIKFLPRVYHGIISKSILDQIYKITGSYFPGPSPDMANAIASVLLIQKYIFVNLPLILSGYSYKSAGGMGLRGTHKGLLKDVKQLPKKAEEEWSPKIPKLWLGYTVWPESAEKAFIKMGYNSYIKKINYYAMEAKIYLKYPEYRSLIMQRNIKIVDKLSLSYECFRFFVRWLVERILLEYRKFSNKQFTVYKEIPLKSACEVLNIHNNQNYFVRY